MTLDRGGRPEEGRGRRPVDLPSGATSRCRAKWRIAEGRGQGPTLGARFGVILPQTSFEDIEFNPLGLGPNTLRAFVEGLRRLAFTRCSGEDNTALRVTSEPVPAVVGIATKGAEGRAIGCPRPTTSR